MPHRLILTGIPITPLRSKGNNLFSFDMKEKGSKIPMPKGLPSTNEIYYTVFCNLRQINRAGIDRSKFQETILVVDGEPTLDNFQRKEITGQIGLVCRLLKIIDLKGEEQTEDKDEKESKEEIEVQMELIVMEIPLKAIVIPEQFLKFSPRQEKIEAKVMQIRENGGLEKPIEVRKSDFLLLDGYTSYLAAIKLGLRSVEVVFKE